MPFLINQSLAAAFGVVAVFFFAILLTELRRNASVKGDKRELEKAAKLFLMVHKDEVDYLPYCAVAADQCSFDIHVREIYNDFCKCPKELQREIFKQSPFSYLELPYVDWVTDALEKLKQDIAENNLGDVYLYDNSRYFRQAYEDYKNLPVTRIDITASVFRRIYGTASGFNLFQKSERQKFSDYLAEYLYYLDGMSDEEPVFDPIPPLDYLWCEMGLDNESEDQVCGWIMEIVLRVSTQLNNRKNDRFSNYETPCLTYAKIETYEDKYFKCLMTLYQAYIKKI